MNTNPEAIPRPITDEFDCVIEPVDAYMVRAKAALPDMPEDVIDQWLLNHPQVIDETVWGWLDLASLQFTLEEWDARDIPAVDQDENNAVHTYRYYLDRRKPADLSHRMRRLVEYFEEHGTWPRSPIFLDNLQGQHASPFGWACSMPYQLLEGHHRMAVFSLFRDQHRIQDTHRIWVARKPNP